AIQSVCQDNHGGIWFGINNFGVDYWSNGVVREYGRKEGLSNLDAPTVFVDRSNKVWVGTSGGLFQLQGDRFDQVEELRAVSVSALYQDRKGLLWFSTKSGLVCWDQHKFTPSADLSGKEVRAIAEDSTGDLW